MPESATIPTLRSLSFPSNSSEEFLHIVSNLFSESECNSIIKSHNDLVPANETGDTIRSREMFFDSALAEMLWNRLQPFYENDVLQDEEGNAWKIKGLNDRFRLARYDKGGKFSPHQDGRRLASVDEQSFMTLNMYLNDVPSSHGGATRVLSTSTPADMHAKRPLKVLAKVQPVLGSAAIFRDLLWHDGEELTEGVKYLLRTDILYERVIPFDFDAMYGDLDDREKGEKAVEIASGLEDACQMEEALRWYKKAARFSSTYSFLHDSMAKSLV